jgi:hypothetical protein
LKFQTVTPFFADVTGFATAAAADDAADDGEAEGEGDEEADAEAEGLGEGAAAAIAGVRVVETAADGADGPDCRVTISVPTTAATTTVVTETGTRAPCAKCANSPRGRARRAV